MNTEHANMETQFAQDVDFKEVAKKNLVLAEFNFPLAKIAEMRDRAKALVIASVDDKRGYNAVKEFRLDIRDKRIAVEKRHKEGKAEALEIGRNWDKAKNLLLAELEPIEAELQAKQDVIDAEIQAEKDRKQAEINAKVKARQDALIAVEAIQEIHPMDLAGMAERDFQAHLSVFTEAFNARKAKADAEAAELERLRAAEAQRQAEARIEQERVAKEQAERQAALDAKEKALQDAQDKLDRDRRHAEEKTRKEAESKARAEELERVRLEAAEKATRDAEAAALKREADAKASAERLAKAEEARKETERVKAAAKAAKAPDIEKLEKYLSDIRGVNCPNIRDPNLQGVLISFTNQIVAFDQAIRESK